MKIFYFLNAFIVSLIFFLYKCISNTNTSSDNTPLFQKQFLKESLVLFFLSSAVNFVIGEYFYKDFIQDIFNESVRDKPTEVFTNKPDF